MPREQQCPHVLYWLKRSKSKKGTQKDLTYSADFSPMRDRVGQSRNSVHERRRGLRGVRDTQFSALVEAAREGDQSALGHLLDSFRSYLRLFSDRRLGPDLKQKCGESDLV